MVLMTIVRGLGLLSWNWFLNTSKLVEVETIVATTPATETLSTALRSSGVGAVR
jgi:hypothetical protein